MNELPAVRNENLLLVFWSPNRFGAQRYTQKMRFMYMYVLRSDKETFVTERASLINKILPQFQGNKTGRWYTDSSC